MPRRFSDKWLLVPDLLERVVLQYDVKETFNLDDLKKFVYFWRRSTCHKVRRSAICINLKHFPSPFLSPLLFLHVVVNMQNTRQVDYIKLVVRKDV